MIPNRSAGAAIRSVTHLVLARSWKFFLLKASGLFAFQALPSHPISNFQDPENVQFRSAFIQFPKNSGSLKPVARLSRPTRF